MLLSFLASLLAHPTNVFLIPIALPVFLVQLDRKGEGDPSRRRRIRLCTATVALVIVAAFSMLMLGHPVARHFLRNRPALHWSHFLDGYERVLFFLYAPASKAVTRWFHWGFRGVFLVLLALGAVRLVRERRWERLSLVVGLAASLSGFHLMAGPELLRQYGTHRYGVVFLVPTVLACACLLRSLFPTLAPEATRPAMLRAPLTVALVLGWAMLLGLKLNYLDPTTRGLRESFWTFRSDGKDEFERALSLIQRDIARTRASHHPDAKTPTEFAQRAPRSSCTTTGPSSPWPTSPAPARISKSSG